CPRTVSPGHSRLAPDARRASYHDESKGAVTSVAAAPDADRHAHADHLDRCLNVEAASLLARPRPSRSAGAHPAQQLSASPSPSLASGITLLFDVLARTKIADPDARGDGSQLQITPIDR